MSYMDDQQLRIVGVVVFYAGIVPTLVWLKQKYCPKGLGYALGRLLGRARQRTKRTGRQAL